VEPARKRRGAFRYAGARTPLGLRPERPRLLDPVDDRQIWLKGRRRRIKVQTKGALDALMLNITLAPGGNGGWHSHAGPAITIVKQGTVTTIDAKCKRHDVPAGHAVISTGSSPPRTRTEARPRSWSTSRSCFRTRQARRGSTSPRQPDARRSD
jgi:hypothetical protein